MAVSKEERDAFLQRQGVTAETTEAEIAELIEYWHGEDGIEYAIEMGA